MAYKVAFGKALNEELEEREKREGERIKAGTMLTSFSITFLYLVQFPGSQCNILKTKVNQMLVGEAGTQKNFSVVWLVGVMVKGAHLKEKTCKL